MKLYLATGNLHKIEELRKMLAAASLDLEVLPPSSVGGMPEVDEDQNTFSGNALKKARALADLLPSDGWALADDSGLCVDALGGAPGVFSARYAGENATDLQNTEKLLNDLDLLDSSDRSASFQCHLALVAPDGESQIFSGVCSGKIIQGLKGKGGFGYDPVFIPDGFEQTFAELSSNQKASLSHRGKAIGELVNWLRQP